MDLEGIAILHLERIGCISGLDSRAVEKKSHGAGRLSLALAKGAHKLLQLCGTLDLEEDLVVVVGDLDVEVLGVGGCLLTRSPVFVLVGHFELV